MHGTLVWASAKLCGVEQRAPPIFGRSTIRLGICPHSSFDCHVENEEFRKVSGSHEYCKSGNISEMVHNRNVVITNREWPIESRHFRRPWETFKVIHLLQAFSNASFSKREVTFTFTICCRPSVCRLSVTLVHPTLAVEIFGNISTAFGTLAIHWHPRKFLRRSSQGTPPSGELNTTGVAKYSDFGLIKGYISETVQDRRKIKINH